ncbi:MAG: DUF6314 family protein [Devosia sp.]
MVDGPNRRPIPIADDGILSVPANFLCSTGTAMVVERADGLLSYREQDQLDLAGSAYAFTRNYIHRSRPSGFDVLFDKPELRLFQRVDMRLNESQ